MPFTPPPPTEYTVLNLGAGVQSSALALMAAHGEITPMPDFAVFADTGAEPQNVYDWLDWLEKQLPYPVYRVSKGNLTDDQLSVKIREKDAKSGAKKGDTYISRSIPVFGYHKGKRTAAIGRKCTSDFKVLPILKEIKKRCNIKRGQKEITVTQWIGISWDEIQRARPAKDKWTQHSWPLLTRRITRAKCHEWMKEHGYPEPPRSACYYCPFHSGDEWRRLRDEDPEHFQKAVEFDSTLRANFKKYDKTMRMEIFIHNSCKPLGEVDFDNDEDRG